MQIDNSQVLITGIRERLEELENRRKMLLYDVEHIDLDHDALANWLADLQRHHASNGEVKGDDGLDDRIQARFADMSVRQVLHAIARENSRVLVMRDALGQLVRAGIYPSVKKASPPVYARMSVGVKKGEWQKKKPGVYTQVRDPFAPVPVFEANGTEDQAVPEQRRLATSSP